VNPLAHPRPERGPGLLAPVVSLVLVVAAGCSSGSAEVPRGSALARALPGYASFGPIPPGQQVESLDVDVQNASSRPVTLLGVSVSGPGVGAVGRIVRMQIAPIPNTDAGTNWIPDGEWVTYPPADLIQHTCRVQRLLPLRGYTLAPEARARLAMTLEALRPGLFAFRSVLVRYSTRGEQFVQRIPLGTRFTVADAAPPRPVSRFERPCVSKTGTLPRG